MPQWKNNFLEHYKSITDIEKFTETSLLPLRKSIRVNTLKTTVAEISSRFQSLKPVSWCKEGFFIDKLAVGNTLEHFLGYIYLQGAASMIPPIALNPKPEDIVLDMCASPGSKTSQIAALMKNQGLIVANDPKIDRLKPLVMNLQRCGVQNVVTTRMEGRWFTKTQFPKILVDAPCSGVGTIRKSLYTIQMWNPNMIRKFAGVQRQLIFTAFDALQEGGTLVYSTCTLEPQENEGVINALLQKYGTAQVKHFSLEINRSPCVEEFEGESYDSDVKKCLRIWPQDNDTEGFFVAKVIKK